MGQVLRMSSLAYAFLGLLIGLILDIIWIQKVDEKPGPLNVLEHYHHALWIMIVNCLFFRSEFLTAFAAALLLAEHFQEHPYSFRSNHFLQSTLIGAFLAIAFLWSLWMASVKP